MLVVALQAQCHSQSFTLAAHVSERIIVRVTAVSLVVCVRPTSSNHSLSLSVNYLILTLFFITCLFYTVLSVFYIFKVL